MEETTVNLSVFDGCNMVGEAWRKAKLPYTRWCISEIDKYASAVARFNNPTATHLGDIKNIKTEDGYLLEPINGGNVNSIRSRKGYRKSKVFLLVGGSPCQDLSFAGKGKGLEGERSGLFFEYVRLLKELKPKYFLLENVKMKKEHMDVITDLLGVEPIAINSADFSAQNRQRLYWTNIPVNSWDDKGIILEDIIEDGAVDREKAHCIDANYFKGGNLRSYFGKHRRQLVFDKKCIQVGEADINGFDAIRRVYSTEGKAPTLTTMQGGHREPKIICGAFRGRYKVDGVRQDHKHSVAGMTTQQLEMRVDAKTNTLTTVQKDNVAVNLDELKWRKLTVRECERLQTLHDDYTEYGIFEDPKLAPAFWSRKKISNTQRYKMIGNGFTVDVIAHILGGIPND